MRVLIVVGGILLPAVANSKLEWKDTFVSFVSLVVAGCASLEGVLHYRDQWKNYRSTEQFLGREQVLFLTGEGIYKDIKDPRNALVAFIERCETAIEQENKSTLNIMTLTQDAHKDAGRIRV